MLAWFEDLANPLLLYIAEMTFVKYIGQMEPAEVCMMVGTCLDAAVARVGKPVPLQAQSVAAVGRLMAAAGQVQGMMQAANPSNDQCDTCKVRACVLEECSSCCMVLVRQQRVLVVLCMLCALATSDYLECGCQGWGKVPAVLSFHLYCLEHCVVQLGSHCAAVSCTSSTDVIPRCTRSSLACRLMCSW
jgi:hypothetical protein